VRESGELDLMKEQISKIFGFSDKVDEVKNIPVQQITSSPYQPRSIFDDEKIDELCQTIKTHGIIQPIVLRAKNEGYEIIAGERRWRAVKKLGLETIPAIIRDFNDSQTASIALIENLQRENLTSIEEATAYHQLMVLHGLTQESLAQRLGKNQSTIANKIRLLQLVEPIKEALMNKSITERHARALLSLESEELQLRVLEDIIKKELNVKQTEMRVNFYKEDLMIKKKKRFSSSKDIRLALNTIRQSIEMVKGSGLTIITDENEHEEHYQITIKIPKKQ
jgi:ParB family chromosome partitioning protein